MILHAITRGEGPPLALLHGLFGHSVNFGTVQRRLAGSHRVLALDLRNHGASPRAPLMNYPAMAADVLETLTALAAVPAAVLGHSMGGKVAMALALAAPDAVSRLIVADIAPVAYPPHFRGHIEAMRAIRLHPGLNRAEADAALAAVEPDPRVRGFLLQNLRFGVEPSWRIAIDAIAAELPQIEDWPHPGERRYPGPTLFIGGERSTYILPEYRPLIRELFPAARFVTLKDSGHWLHADAPEAFVKVVAAFLG